MKSKVVEDADVVTYVVVCDPGDEAVSALMQFARSERLEAAQITAVSAFEHATVGWFGRYASGVVRRDAGPSVQRCCAEGASRPRARAVLTASARLCAPSLAYRLRM
jgi:hypothetical protein